MAQTVTATDAELPKPVNAVFNQTFLRRAQQNAPYFAGTQPGTLTRQQGTSTIKWRRIEQETPSTTALTELTGTSSYMQGRDSDVPTVTDVVATVSKYGQFYIVNEEVDLYNPNGTTDELVAVLGESAGRSLNMLMRNIWEDNATARYAGGVGSTAAVVAKVTAADLDYIINQLTRNSARTFTPMTTGSTNIGTAPILPGFWALTHPDVAYDVAKITGFKSVETYAGQVATVSGEFGLYAGAGKALRFVMSEDSSVDAGQGADVSAGMDIRTTLSSDADVYSTVIYGMDAAGSVGLGKRHTDGIYRAGDNTGGWELIHHGYGSGGISDPYNEIQTIAWKAFFAGAILNSAWAFVLKSAATNIATV